MILQTSPWGESEKEGSEYTKANGQSINLRQMFYSLILADNTRQFPVLRRGLQSC